MHTGKALHMGGKKMGNRKWEHLIISPDYVPPVMDDVRDDKGDIKTGRTLGQTERPELFSKFRPFCIQLLKKLPPGTGGTIYVTVHSILKT